MNMIPLVRATEPGIAQVVNLRLACELYACDPSPVLTPA